MDFKNAVNKFTFIGLLGITVIGNAAYTWKSVQIRGGGYVPGVTFHPNKDGLVYARTDVGGSYRLQASNERLWTPLNDSYSNSNDMGAIAIAVDPKNDNAVYATGGLYTNLSWCGTASFLRSDDQGATWTKIALNSSSTVTGTNTASVKTDGSLCFAGNGEGRGMGNRIAANGNTIYLGTNQNGLLKSTNRGNTWTTVSQFSNTSGVGAVQFDSNGVIYAAPYAGGLFKSNDGSTWTQIGSLSSTIYQISYSKVDHTLWITTNTSSPLDQGTSGGGSVYKYAITSNTLTQVTMPSKGNYTYAYVGISANSKVSGQVVVSTSGTWKGKGGPIDGNAFVPHEAIFLTTDGGTTWSDILLNSTMDVASAFNAASSNPHWISALAIDPFDKDHVIFGTGYGVWSTFNATAAKPTWYFTNEGLEETVPLGLASTPYGAPLVSVLGDIDGFYHADLDVPPMARHKVEDGKSEAGTNYDIDWAAKLPNYMVRIYKESKYGLGGYSVDGGKTWKNFATHPNFVANQYSNTASNEDNFVAVSPDGSAIVWNMATYGVYYSTNNGLTWTASATAANLLQGFRVVADRVTAGTFYLYNAKAGVLYKSTNNGAAWTAVNSSLAKVDDWAFKSMRLAASPDKSGELWITQGANIYNCETGCSWSENYKEGLWYGTGGVHKSTDGGTSFTKVNGLLFGKYIGFGKGISTSSAIYVVGMLDNGLQGVMRSTDNGSSWTRITNNEQQFGGIEMAVGDPCIYSRVYVSGAARGIMYGADGVQNNSCVDRVDKGSVVVLGKNSLAPVTLQRVGTLVVSNAPIRMYTITGKLMAVAGLEGEFAHLNLAQYPQGMYVIRSGNSTLRVSQ